MLTIPIVEVKHVAVRMSAQEQYLQEARTIKDGTVTERREGQKFTDCKTRDKTIDRDP
jgi:hypothetical protein